MLRFQLQLSQPGADRFRSRPLPETDDGIFPRTRAELRDRSREAAGLYRDAEERRAGVRPMADLLDRCMTVRSEPEIAEYREDRIRVMRVT